MGGGGTDTTTQSQTTAGTTKYAPWTQDMQKGIAGTGWGLAQNFLNQAPTNAVAGFTPDQMKGFDMLRGTAQQYGRDNASGLINGLGDRSQAQAAQIDTNRIGELMNPFLGTVGKNTVDSMRREYQNNDAGMAARYANASAFGGSGEALARGQASRGYGKNVGDMVDQLMAQGYDTASAQALAEAQMRQQTNTSNSNNAINAATAASGIMSADQQRQLGAIGGLLAGGQTQQNLAQQSLNVPFDMAKFVASLIPGVYDSASGSTTSSSTSAPSDSPSTLQSLLGLGTTVLGGKSSTGGTVGGDLLSSLFG